MLEVKVHSGDVNGQTTTEQQTQSIKTHTVDYILSILTDEALTFVIGKQQEISTKTFR